MHRPAGKEYVWLQNNNYDNSRPLLLTIFGGTGDLAKRKLLPALYYLSSDSKLPEELHILFIGRKPMDNDGYRQYGIEAIRQYSHTDVDEKKLAAFSQKIFYHQMEFISEPGSYAGLETLLSSIQKSFDQPSIRIFFLAVGPEHFEPIVQCLHDHGLADKGNLDHRVMVEKPFGSDLNSARELNKTISEALDEQQVYRIDHYLVKEMIRNIMAIRFANSLFEPLWNHNYVDNIQITSVETLGIEDRGPYYEHSGILKDMLQNHLLQMLALITMEPPVDLMPESVRDEKVKALRSLRSISAANSCGGIVQGQYGQGVKGDETMPAYREESGVDKNSATPTFVALKAQVDNFRWGGVPIYIRAGKRLDRSLTQIVVEFKKLPGVNFYKEFKGQPPNLLVIEVQPAEGMYFRINLKRPGNDFNIGSVALNYAQHSRFTGNVPEAYEQLLLEAYRANSSLFTRWDELEYSWQFIEGIQKNCQAISSQFPNYGAGSRGPEAADIMIQQDGRKWWEIDLDCEGPDCIMV
ncbi:MAG: glucose-6-phosphate dehydrogenase [Clostridiales bacterium]|nr:glucose-6-phosphate dehydrogenase [Clostridiales bacterium]